MRKFLTPALFAILLFGSSLTAVAKQDKITICHAAGREGTIHFVTLTIGYKAVFGPGGHFFEDGTPRAGHEEDYFGACKTPSPSTNPSSVPSVSPSVPASVEPSSGPSETPSVSPTPNLTLPPTDTEG